VPSRTPSRRARRLVRCQRRSAAHRRSQRMPHPERPHRWMISRSSRAAWRSRVAGPRTGTSH